MTAFFVSPCICSDTIFQSLVAKIRLNHRILLSDQISFLEILESLEYFPPILQPVSDPTTLDRICGDGFFGSSIDRYILILHLQDHGTNAHQNDSYIRYYLIFLGERKIKRLASDTWLDPENIWV